MGIRDRQLTNEAKRVLQKELLAGRYPDLSTVQQMVADKFRNRVPGLPRFELKPVANKQVSNADNYNEMIHNLHEDLFVAFDEVRYQGDRMMSLADYYETEKQRVHLQLRKLNRRMEVLTEKLEDRGLREVIFETFNNYLTIEFDGDRTRSLPVTDAFVDLRHGYASLDNGQSTSTKIDLSKAHAVVNPVTSFHDFTQLGAVDNALRDTVNESWRHRGIMQEPKPAEITITIELDSVQKTNFISFTPLSARPVIITVGTSFDGESYSEELPREASSLIEWNFEEREIKFVRFKLKKNEPDMADGAEYHYYFGAQNISMKSTQFVQTNYVVSKEHKVHRVVDKVTLSVDEVIPPGTKIEYFLAEDKMDGGILEWESIEPNKKILFGGLEQESILVDDTSPLYGMYYTTAYSHDYHSIIQLSKTPASRTMEILVGEGMYQVDSMDYSGEPTFLPTLDTWKNAREYTTSFLPLWGASAGTDMPVSAGKVERMTLYVNMTSDYVLHANPLDKKADMKVSVYLNNIEIKPIGTDYTYQFKKGLNKLEVIYHAPTGGFIAPNLAKNYLESIGATSIYATNESLKQIDVYDMLNNTSKKDYTKFAINDDNTVILNYDPKAFDRTGHGVRYTINYRYAPDGAADGTHLRFMAKLYRNSDGDLTPLLKAYKLIVE